MFVFACLVLPILLVTQAGDWGAVFLIGLAGAAHQAWSANLFTTVSDMFPKRAVASVVGLGGMAGSLGGILFPLYTGKLLDRFQASGNVTAGYTILFAICGSAYLLAFGISHRARRETWGSRGSAGQSPAARAAPPAGQVGRAAAVAARPAAVVRPA